MGLRDPVVVIVGGGAMGGLFGGLMAEKGLQVTLVDVWREHIDAIKSQGLRIVGVGGDRAIRIGATTDPSTVTVADVVLFQCKAFANPAAAASVKHLFKGQTVAVSFQNGLGNEEALSTVLGTSNVMGGLTAQAGRVEAPGVVRNFGDLPTYIGEMNGGLSDRATTIADAFSRHGLNTHASADIKREKWKKLLGNVGLSALSGVTDLRSMDIMAVPELQTVVFRAVDEAAAVARAVGVDLDAQEARSVLMTLTVSKDGGTGTAKSSLNGDLMNRRPTEVDFIYGTVARLGRERGVPTPTIDALIGIVKGLESKYLGAPRG
ncbi:MAG: ketopantoate reductase family protein [Alphaproteobacteria bacterium]|nr:ketopantoate reductase family protein [Alphaproteobacteria bacterium]